MQAQILDALRRGDTDAAVELARALVAQTPDDADAQRALALALRQHGDIEGAREAIGRALALAPDDARLHLASAGLLLDARDIEGAQEALQTTIDRDPNHFTAYIMQGHLALAQRDLEEAGRLARLAERVAPGHPSLLVLQGSMALLAGDADRALGLLSTATGMVPRDPTALHALGCAYLAKEHFAFAEQTFQTLLGISPASPTVRLMLAQVQLRQGRPADAVEGLAPLLADSATVTPALSRFAGELELAAGRPDRALPLLRQALAGLPRSPQVLRAIVETWGRLGDGEDARRTLDAALATAPDSDGLWRARLVFEPAPAALIARWREHMPDSIAALEADMELHASEGRLEQAEAAAQALVERAPGHARAELRIVDALLARDPAAAGARLDGLIAQAARPEDRSMLEAWRAMAWHRSGDFAEALGIWNARNAADAPGRIALPPATPAAVEWPAPAPAAADAPPAAFLVGLPGSLVERAARLLGTSLSTFRGDRFAPRPPRDAFQDLGAWPRLAAGEHDAATVIGSWREALPARGIDGAIIDWLPWWDNCYAAAMREALPEALLLVVLRDPRDMLVDWLAFGAITPLAVPSPQVAADWLASALGQLATVHEDDVVRHALVRIDDSADDPQAMAAVLGDALGIQLPPPPAGLFGARRFAAGSWRSYADLLAGPFATLAPVARRLGYPDA